MVKYNFQNVARITIETSKESRERGRGMTLIMTYYLIMTLGSIAHWGPKLALVHS